MTNTDKIRTMTTAELFYARQDCAEAAKAMDSIDRADVNGGDRAGKYRDEGAAIAAELLRRGAI
jgi:hypothetical protein